MRFTRSRHVPATCTSVPTASARKVRETLELLGGIFPYRKCRGRPGRRSGSPCLQYFIHRSLAPCDGRVTHEEYEAVVDQVIDFLRGQLTEVGRRIEREMRAAATGRSSRGRRCCATGWPPCSTCRSARRRAPRARDRSTCSACTRESSPATLQVLRVREGALVDRQTFYVENAAGRDPAGRARRVPPRVLRERRGDPAAGDRPGRRGHATPLARAVGARRGARVVVRRRERGPKRRLLEMAGATPTRRPGPRPSASRAAARPASGRSRACATRSALPPAAAHRVLRHLQPRRATRGRLDGGLRGRPPAEGALPQVRASAVRRTGRLRHDARGASSAASRARSATLRSARPRAYDESFAARPDLVVIDGGKGQLSAALEGMRASGAGVAVAPGQAARRGLRAGPRGAARPGGRRSRVAPPAARARRSSPLCSNLPPPATREGGARSDALRRTPRGRPVRRRRCWSTSAAPSASWPPSRRDRAVPGLPGEWHARSTHNSTRRGEAQATQRRTSRSPTPPPSVSAARAVRRHAGKLTIFRPGRARRRPPAPTLAVGGASRAVLRWRARLALRPRRATRRRASHGVRGRRAAALWRACRTAPTVSYRELAAAAGRPGAGGRSAASWRATRSP